VLKIPYRRHAAHKTAQSRFYTPKHSAMPKKFGLEIIMRNINCLWASGGLPMDCQMICGVLQNRTVSELFRGFAQIFTV